MRMAEFANALAEGCVEFGMGQDERWTLANYVATSLQPYSNGHRNGFLKAFVNRDNELSAVAAEAQDG